MHGHGNPSLHLGYTPTAGDRWYQCSQWLAVSLRVLDFHPVDFMLGHRTCSVNGV